MTMKGVLLLTLFFFLIRGVAMGWDAAPAKVRVRGVELHYIELGQGEPVVLLHGGQGDYRSWGPQIKAFSQHYRVISYSRRYNYPNNNPLTAKNHSAYVEAEDLRALIRKLKLGRVHLVGTSIGAFTALALLSNIPRWSAAWSWQSPPFISGYEALRKVRPCTGSS
jgi:pimeloyl-ACP methyl ester carboxylesterase